jgi:hypothetical protein
MTSKVGCLPEVIASVNENFVSVAIEGVLAMSGAADLVDLESLRRVAASCGIDTLPGVRDVRRTARAVTWDWWRSSGYKLALAVIEAKLHLVMCCTRYF